MRATPSILAIGLLFFSRLAAAQQKPSLDLALDGLTGPVRSVSTTSSYPASDVGLPDGSSIVLPIMRQHCEYDPDGYKTLGETPQKGGAYGETMLIGRYAQGQLYDRRTLDRQTGHVTRYERFGQYGLIDDRGYRPDGKLTDEFTQSGDDNGHRSLFVAKDGNGDEVSRRLTKFTADGLLLEDTSWRADGSIEWSEVYSPATGMSQFRNYDATGKLRLSSTSIHDRLTSFWASEENLYGSSTGPVTGTHRDISMCHPDGACDHLISEYSGQDSFNPRSVELRNTAGTLKAGAYYDYVLDDHKNWTSRTVRVKINDKPITLYEQDTRTLLYWPAP